MRFRVLCIGLLLYLIAISVSANPILHTYISSDVSNITLNSTLGSSIKIYNDTGVVYNVNTSSKGDNFTLSDNSTYDIAVSTSTASFKVNNLNMSLFNDSMISIDIVSTNRSIHDALQSTKVVATNMSEFSSSIIYFKKTIAPDGICSCSSWSFEADACDGQWNCTKLSSYVHGSNSTHLWINVTHFSAYVAVTLANNKMTIWDDTNDLQGQNRGHYQGDLTGFFANYTNMSGTPISGGSVYCQITDNSAGWNNKANMTYNATSKLYYIYRGYAIPGIFYFNVMCNGSSQGYSAKLTTTDDFFISTTGIAAYHYEYPIPTDRFINLRAFNVTDPIVYHGINRAYYQKLLKDPSGMYYIYYSDLNTTGGTETFIANSTSGDRFKAYAMPHRPSGHPLVSYSADGFGLNNNYIFWSWDEVSPGHLSPYKKSIMLYYGNYSNLSGLKSMGYINFTWMMGTSNNGTISGTYGINHLFYNASGNGGHSKNPFDYKFAIYFDCAGGSAENLCVVGSDTPTKFNRSSLHKVLQNDTPGAWDNLKLGYGDVQRFKGYYLAIYEGGKVSTREGTGMAYSKNGSGGFVKLPRNPILSRASSIFLNKSDGGASYLIEGKTARLYLAGLNNTGSMYQIIQYLYDVRGDRNYTLISAPNSAITISNTSNGILYNFKSARYGDRVSLLQGMEYNIMVQPTNQQYIRINRLNVSKENASNIVVSIFNLNVSIPGISQLTHVIASNTSGFNSTTIYYLKTFNATKVCYCPVWNFSASNCPAVWSCSPISNYHMKSNSSHTWINVTHFSAYVLGAEAPYVAPSVVGVGMGASNVWAGQNVATTVTVEAGRDDLSWVWFKYNNTIGGSSYAVNGSNNFVFNTTGLYGNYTVSGYVNDSNNTIRSLAGPNVNIYTTTTTSSTSSTTSTTTTTTTSTTTTIVGSLKIVVSNSSGTNFGATVSITRSNGTVIVNKAVSQLSPTINTSTLHNANNCMVKITFTTNDSINILNYNFNTANKTFSFQTRNFTGSKPISLRKIESNVIASNSTNGKTRLIFNTMVEPKVVCSCVDWNFIGVSCAGSWTCSAAANYEHKFNGTAFSFNVTHFSAYVVGAGEYLKIWDDTNDLFGEHIKHFANQYFGFYGNFSNSSNHVITPGMGGYCEFAEMSSGYWSPVVNMSYNSTSKLYYINKNISAIYGDYQYNVTCVDSSYYYGRLTALDDFVVSARTLRLSSTDWAEVYWWSGETIAHTLHYGIYNSSIACDQTHLFYVDGINGTQKKISAATDKTGVYKCQNSSQGAFSISNDGSVSIDVNASFNQVTSGVTMKFGHSNSAWQASCNGSCNQSSCNLASSCLTVNVTRVRISYSLPINTSKEYWMWADFYKVAGTKEPTKGNMTTIATKTK